MIKQNMEEEQNEEYIQELLDAGEIRISEFHNQYVYIDTDGIIYETDEEVLEAFG